MVDSKKDTVIEHKGTLKISVTQCPRCFSKFTCNAANIKQCQCYGVSLQEADFDYLRYKGFSPEQAGCLCRNCLDEIKKIVQEGGGKA